MNLVFNVESKEKFNKDYGDVMKLNDFLECCKTGCFIDYDGFANEILLKGNIIYNEKQIYPSDALANAFQLLNIQKELGELEIVWYNR